MVCTMYFIRVSYLTQFNRSPWHGGKYSTLDVFHGVNLTLVFY